MKEFEAQGGIAFLLIEFKKQSTYYYLTFERLEHFWKRAQDGGRKSFRYDELEKEYIVTASSGVYVHYLPLLQKDLLREDRS